MYHDVSYVYPDVSHPLRKIHSEYIQDTSGYKQHNVSVSQTRIRFGIRQNTLRYSQYFSKGAARRTSRGESAELQASREGGRATEFCVLRVPALLHLRALRSRYPRAPLLCIPCLVRRHHGVAEADAARRPHTAPAVHALRARRPVPPRRATRRSPPPPSWPHAVWQLRVLALAWLLVPEGFLARRTHLVNRTVCMRVCHGVCVRAVYGRTCACTYEQASQRHLLRHATA